MPLTIRPTAIADRAAWDALYAGYARFYGAAQTPQMRDTVWHWLHDGDHGTCGLVAENEDTLVGLAHFRAFARPLSASTGGFLDDLFVAPEARGTGAAAALVDGVKDHGVQQGWSVIRWITAQDNARARGLYDRVSKKTDWVTYDIAL